VLTADYFVERIVPVCVCKQYSEDSQVLCEKIMSNLYESFR
jgi:hypothetical protein